MRDLHLWRLLRDRTPDPNEARPLLDELAGLPLEERAPFLGLLPALLQHPDAQLRRSALRVLAGASGRTALQRIVHALNDGDEAIRRTAVETLRRSGPGVDW